MESRRLKPLVLGTNRGAERGRTALAESRRGCSSGAYPLDPSLWAGIHQLGRANGSLLSRWEVSVDGRHGGQPTVLPGLVSARGQSRLVPARAVDRSPDNGGLVACYCPHLLPVVRRPNL